MDNPSILSRNLDALMDMARKEERETFCTYLERLIEVARTNSNTDFVMPLQLIVRDIKAGRHHDA